MHICARCERLSASHWLIGAASSNNVIYGKRLSVALACRIERETGGAVTRRELLPDIDWDLISGTSLDRALTEGR
jgi:DNA-binding transcriptional regulator YdaS (Cro superfamily)